MKKKSEKQKEKWAKILETCVCIGENSNPHPLGLQPNTFTKDFHTFVK